MDITLASELALHIADKLGCPIALIAYLRLKGASLADAMLVARDATHAGLI